MFTLYIWTVFEAVAKPTWLCSAALVVDVRPTENAGQRPAAIARGLDMPFLQNILFSEAYAEPGDICMFELQARIPVIVSVDGSMYLLLPTRCFGLCDDGFSIRFLSCVTLCSGQKYDYFLPH